MFRTLHRWAGVTAAMILVVVSLTGFALSIFPLLSADRTADRLDAGALIAAVEQAVPGATQIVVDDNANVTATAFGDAGLQQLVIDPATGAALGPAGSTGLELWFENLHRNLFLSDTGHWVVLVATLAMVVLTISGYVLAARRMGGWRKLFARDRGDGAGGLHLKIARIAGIGLILSGITGAWMALSTLGWVPDPSPAPAWPTTVSTGAPVAADTLTTLAAIPGDTIRQITIAQTGSAYLVETDAGAGYVDPVTGDWLSWADRSVWSRLMDVVHLLHTGQGAALLGLILGLASLGVPVLSGSGVLVWLAGRRKGDKAPKVRANEADVIVLVGSEGGTTWRFAQAFASRITALGRKAHLAPMNDFAPETYDAAESIVLFAATYGDGDAPESASEFLAKLDALDAAPTAPLSVLGFGDSTFPEFCAYAERVTAAAKAKGWALVLDTATVDRQSTTDFTRWGNDFAAATGWELGDVSAALGARKTSHLRLVEKRSWGEMAQAPTAILRFALPRRSLADRIMGRGFAKFQAGDLLNVIPEGDDSPRAYSLGSASRDGFVEITVRRQPGGRCSGQLYNMVPGETIPAYVTENAGFHAPKGKAPLILIGAGAGVGALAGMVRANRHGRPAHLYFGTRTRRGGFPYEAEFAGWEAEGRLSGLTVAFSQGERPAYVQQALAEDKERIRDLVAKGAHVMICGGRAMGEGVRETLDQVLRPIGVSTDQLKAEGRYAADVF